jgi:hypothetical protein
MHAKDKTTAARGVHLEHRHYAFIAAVIREMATEGHNAAAEVAERFAKACAGTNVKFNRERFLAACEA